MPPSYILAAEFTKARDTRVSVHSPRDMIIVVFHPLPLGLGLGLGYGFYCGAHVTIFK